MTQPPNRDQTTITRARSSAEYVAAPVRPARATVAVLHPWWGLTDVVTGVCDNLAELGYVAVAPDLYSGDLAATAEEAAALRGRRRTTPMWRQIVAAIEAARVAHGARAVGQVGFSMGGHWALWLARQSRPEIPQIAATVVYYATRAGDFSASRSAFQFHLAEFDPFVSADRASRQERQLRRAGRDAEFHRYPETGHWFFEWDRPDAYEPEAAGIAWQRTVDFLDRYLPGQDGRGRPIPAVAGSAKVFPMGHGNGSSSEVADRSELAVRLALMAELDSAVARLLAAAAANPSADVLVDDSWAVRDVVGHVTFWHESFARNVDDLVHGRRPTPLRGRLSDLNERAVAEARTVPLDTIVARFRVAHATIGASILSPTLGLIPYRVGSRPYTPGEHLEVVRDHILAHARSLEHASDPGRWRTTR